LGYYYGSGFFVPRNGVLEFEAANPLPPALPWPLTRKGLLVTGGPEFWPG